jgi:hypothetical protein
MARFQSMADGGSGIDRPRGIRGRQRPPAGEARLDGSTAGEARGATQAKWRRGRICVPIASRESRCVGVWSGCMSGAQGFLKGENPWSASLGTAKLGNGSDEMVRKLARTGSPAGTSSWNWHISVIYGSRDVQTTWKCFVIIIPIPCDLLLERCIWPDFSRGRNRGIPLPQTVHGRRIGHPHRRMSRRLNAVRSRPFGAGPSGPGERPCSPRPSREAPEFHRAAERGSRGVAESCLGPLGLSMRREEIGQPMIFGKTGQKPRGRLAVFGRPDRWTGSPEPRRLLAKRSDPQNSEYVWMAPGHSGDGIERLPSGPARNPVGPQTCTNRLLDHPIPS